MLRFIHISDTHIGPDPTFQLYGRNTLQDAQNMVHFLNHELPFAPAFILHSGDVTNFQDESSARLAAQVMQPLKFPVKYVVGNHDSRAHLRQYLMGQPASADRLFYDFMVEDFHFLVLDTLGEVDPQGSVTSEQLDWLAEKLATSPARSLCLFVHHLPLVMGVPWYDRDMRIMNDEELFALLRPHRDRLRGVFFGHIHRAFTGLRDGILCSAAASTFRQFHTYPADEKPNFDMQACGGYAIVTLTHDHTTVTHHTIPRPEDKD